MEDKTAGTQDTLLIRIQTDEGLEGIGDGRSRLGIVGPERQSLSATDLAIVGRTSS